MQDQYLCGGKMNKAYKPARKGKTIFFEWVLPFVILISIVFAITFIVGLAVVNGDSMNPTMHDGDLLVVRKTGGSYKPGDIVLIDTKKANILYGEVIVKRIAAVEGQSIMIDEDMGTIYVDGNLYSEPIANQNTETVNREGRSGFVVGRG
jgi:signal peptidase I